MLEPYASFFVRWFTDYQEIDRKLARWEARKGGRVPRQDLIVILESYPLHDAAEWFRELGMRHTERQLRIVHEFRNAKPAPKAAELRTALRQMTVTIRDDAEECVFLFVAPATASVYFNPLHDWPKVVDAFPDAVEDIESAAECLALQQPTASVFHSMRVLEKGLRGLARRLGVPMGKVADGTWEDILNAIEGDVNRRYRQAPPGATKLSPAQKKRRKVSLTYYHGLLIHFRYFKDVWRNFVMHDKASYNNDQARGAFQSVRDFMVNMAGTKVPHA
jgi:hypothetical protein